MTELQISVIVPAFNEAQRLGDCLRALAAQTIQPGETIVVDDGSTDETAQIAREMGASVIRQENAGPAAARNRGARAAGGELLVFTDADCRPAADFLETISARFEDRQLAGARGAYTTRQLEGVPRFVQQEYGYKYQRMMKLTSINFIDTYAAAYRREIFLSQGGFDAAYPTASVEDQEFSFRLAAQGQKMIFIPEARVDHLHDRNLAEYVRRKFGIGYWKAFLLRRHPERLIQDSHTPLAQRLQVGLLPLLLIAGTAALFFPPSGWLALALLIFFAGSAVPEMLAVCAGDRKAGRIAPLMILVRAAALSSGLLIGALFTPLTSHRNPLGWQERLAKRLIDLLISILGLMLSAPLLLMAALAIKLDSRGPVFFRQVRVGEGGKPFVMVKLRTMVKDAEAQLDQVIEANALHGPAFKIPQDPRVTRVGRILRRWSIDELPQLWNVFKGEMSLVGPRPEEVRVVERYNDWQRKRLAVRPGITGPMQVAGRGALDLDARVALELDYIEHYSLGRDLRIIFNTLPAVFSGEGAL